MKPTLTKQDIYFAIVATTALSIGYLASDICLPALPLLVKLFHITNGQAQHILSVYFFGLGTALLISGPIVDHVGFRKVALIACLGLLLTSLACALTWTQPMLMTARFFQALCAGFLATTARASFVKYYHPDIAALMFIRATPASSLAPAAAPFIGGYLIYHMSWHATFLFIVIVCALLFAALLRIFHIPDDNMHKPLPTLGSIGRTYANMLSNPIFLGYLITVMAVFCVYLVYITDAPFVFHQFHWTTVAIGYSFTPVALTFFISSQITRPLLRRYATYRIMCVGVLLEFSSFLFFALIQHNHWPIATLILAASLMAFANGFISPLCFRSALPLYKNNSGVASSLFTAIPFLASTLASYFVHALCGTNLASLALFCAAMMAFGCIGLVMTRKHASQQ